MWRLARAELSSENLTIWVLYSHSGYCHLSSSFIVTRRHSTQRTYRPDLEGGSLKSPLSFVSLHLSSYAGMLSETQVVAPVEYKLGLPASTLTAVIKGG